MLNKIEAQAKKNGFLIKKRIIQNHNFESLP